MTPRSFLPALPPGARILIIRLRSIGDIVLLTPALRLLKQWRPDFRISVVVESRFRELLEGSTDVEEILELGNESGGAKFLGRIQMVRELRRKGFSICVNLHGGPTSALLAAASGARIRAGFAHFSRRWVYHALVPDARQILGQESVHTAEHQASAFFWMGLPQREIPRATLSVSSAHQAWWSERHRSLDLSREDEYALIHPTALYFTKQWSPENFARLGGYLERASALKALYTCGPGESATLDAVERAAGGSIRRLEGASLGRFAAALAGARLFIGNDSGPAHMAAALERPSVVIFGSSSSRIWGPWPRQDSMRPSSVVQNFYDCNPCPGDRCYRFDRPECILSVTFEQVRSAVEDVLARAGQLCRKDPSVE